MSPIRPKKSIEILWSYSLIMRLNIPFKLKFFLYVNRAKQIRRARQNRKLMTTIFFHENGLTYIMSKQMTDRRVVVRKW